MQKGKNSVGGSHKRWSDHRWPRSSVVISLERKSNYLTHLTYKHVNNKYITLNLERKYLVGSSKNITGGLLIISRAIESLLLSPPDNLLVMVFLA